MLSHMDFAELGQDADEKVIVPTDPFQLAAHRSLARFQPRQIQFRLPQQRQVFGAMPLPVQRVILVAGYIRRPMQPILNPPRSPQYGIEPFRREGFAQQVAATLLAHRPILLPNGAYFAHRSQTRPVVRLRQPCRISADAGDAGFNRPRSFLRKDWRSSRLACPKSSRSVPFWPPQSMMPKVMTKIW